MSFRRDFISKPIFSWARGVLPAMSDTDRGRTGLPQRPCRRALRHARRVEDQLGMARSAAGGVGLHQAPQILRHDHPQGVWRAWLLALCAFGSGAKTFLALADRGPHRDGAEFARAG